MLPAAGPVFADNVTATVPVGSGPHGMAITPNSTRAYVRATTATRCRWLALPCGDFSVYRSLTEAMAANAAPQLETA